MDGYSAKSDRINSTYLKDLVGNLLTPVSIMEHTLYHQNAL